MSYGRDVVGKDKDLMAKELTLSATPVGTVAQCTLTEKAWFLPARPNGNENHLLHTLPQRDTYLLWKKKKKSSFSPLVLPLVHLSLQLFSWCQVVSGMFLGSKVYLVLSCTAWKRWSAVQKCSCAVRYRQTSRFMPMHWVARVCLLVQLLFFSSYQ